MANTFDPNAEITSEQSVSDWARDETSKAIAAGLMRGKGAGILDPQSDTLRVEAAQAIFNLFVK